LALEVVTVTPASGSQGQPLEPVIRVTFNGLVNQATVTPETLVVSQKTRVSFDQLLTQDVLSATTVVSGSLSFDTVDGASRVSFIPSSPLTANTLFTVLLSTGIKASDGSALASIYSWKFSTGDGAVITPPADSSDIATAPYPSSPVIPLAGLNQTQLYLVSATPANQSVNLALDTVTITLRFNKALALDNLGDPVGSFTLVSEPVDEDGVNHPATGNLIFTSQVDDNILTIVIDSATTPLLTNNLVVLTAEDLQATDGSVLASPLTYFFTTLYSPLYSTATLVRLRVGAYIKEIPNYTVYLALLKGSIESDWIVPQAAAQNQIFQDIVNYYKTQYALVTACFYTLSNTEDLGMKSKSKTLGDMEVSWEQSQFLLSFIGAIANERKELAQEINNLGANPLCPQMAVKGAMDWDRPLIGRDYAADPFSVPLVNDSVKPPYSRRKVGTYTTWYWRPRGRLY
jgi:hypothetical protein